MMGYLGQLSPRLQVRFADETLTMNRLQSLVNEFESDVQAGVHKLK
jgi:hypothetical protein